jgi:hypothetical protein
VWVVAAIALVAVATGGTAAVLKGRSGSTPTASTSTGHTATNATNGADAAPTTSASTSATGPSSSAAGTEPSATASGFAALLLQPDRPPLAGWASGDDGSLAALLGGEDVTSFFCDTSVDLSTDQKASAIFTSGVGVRVLTENIYRLGDAKAKAAMNALRASASCGTWKVANGQAFVQPGPTVTAGDEAAAYRLDSPTAIGALHTYQVFFRSGGDLGWVTILTTDTLTPADQDLAARAAATGAARLGG